MYRAQFLLLTAIFEAGTGILLLVRPAAMLGPMVGGAAVSPDVAIIARIAGASLLALGVMCWCARNDQPNPSQIALLRGIFLYDVGAAAILAQAGMTLAQVGSALWLAVAAHTVLAVWCVACLRIKPGSQQSDRSDE